MAKETVAVLFGGQSAEHEISVITALQCIQAIDTYKYTVVPVYISPPGKWYTGERLLDRTFYKQWNPSASGLREISLLPDPSIKGFVVLPSLTKIPVDVCFLAFHGQQGEDGCAQGLLELAGIPYTGSDVMASALTMNKFLTKAVLRANGIAVLPAMLVKKTRAQEALSPVIEQIEANFSYPLFIKPNHLGSSIGIGKASNREELIAGLARVFLYDDKALLEPCVEQLMEVNVAVLDGNPPEVSVVEVPKATEGALSYEDKYLRNGSKSSGSNAGMASLSRVINPKNLSEDVKKKIQRDALHAFELLGCSGVCRIDFMIDQRLGGIYLNEVNAIPGSLSFYLWNHTEPQKLFPDLIDQLIVSAKQRQKRANALNREFGFHAL